MKNWYESKTIWGALLLMVSGSAASIGVTIDPLTGDFHGNFYNMTDKLWPFLSQIAAGGLIWYGRAKATQPIKPVRTKKVK